MSVSRTHGLGYECDLIPLWNLFDSKLKETERGGLSSFYRFLLGIT